MSDADRDLARAVERGDLPGTGFPHAAHLRVACVYLAEAPTPEAAEGRMADTLRRVAASAGHPGKYHHTVTCFRVRLLAEACDEAGSTDFDAVAARWPALLDKNLPLAFYSRGRIDADEARHGWVEPDRQPLSLHAARTGTGDSSRDAPHRPLSR